MKRSTKIAVAIGAALSLGLAGAAVYAHPYGTGWGGGPGYGMHGYGMGPGAGGGPGYGMHGYGMGPGAGGGPGYGMHGSGMGPGAGGGPGYGMHVSGMGPGAGFDTRRGSVEDRLTALKSTLGITASQDSAWQAFAAKAKQQAETREAWFAKRRDAQAPATAPERLAQRDEFMKQQQAEMETMAGALKDLYAALTPEQKAIADQRFGGFGPGHRAGLGGRLR